MPLEVGARAGCPRLRLLACADGRLVIHDRVEDADHGWPGGDSPRPFSSTVRTWQFLRSARVSARAGGSTW